MEEKNKTLYLVTGATGFLGREVCKSLIKKGKNVRALVLKNGSRDFLPSEVECTEGNLLDIDTLESFFSVPDDTETYIFHIASIDSFSGRNEKEMMDVNVLGTKNIIDMCLLHTECKKLVYCGSTCSIPELPHGNAIKETYDFNPDLVAGCYSKSIALASKEVLSAVKERNLTACIVQPTGILGPGDYSMGNITNTIIRFIKKKSTAVIDGSFNLCDVRDLAEGTLSAMEKGVNGGCYILGNDLVSFREFARIVSEITGSELDFKFISLKLSYALANIAEFYARLTKKEPVLTKLSIHNLARNNVFDSSKAKKELGFACRPYKETIIDEIYWLKSMKKF